MNHQREALDVCAVGDDRAPGMKCHRTTEIVRALDEAAQNLHSLHELLCVRVVADEQRAHYTGCSAFDIGVRREREGVAHFEETQERLDERADRALGDAHETVTQHRELGAGEGRRIVECWREYTEGVVVLDATADDKRGKAPPCCGFRLQLTRPEWWSGWSVVFVVGFGETWGETQKDAQREHVRHDAQQWQHDLSAWIRHALCWRGREVAMRYEYQRNKATAISSGHVHQSAEKRVSAWTKMPNSR